MKKITEEQIKAILDELFKLNIPTQSYAGIQKLFADLPVDNSVAETEKKK